MQGSVNSEGIYSILKYPDLKSLIQIAGKGISKNTYLEKVDITRVDNQGKKSFKTFNLGEILSDNSNFKLKQDDIVRVYSLEEVRCRASKFLDSELTKKLFLERKIYLYTT